MARSPLVGSDGMLLPSSPSSAGNRRPASRCLPALVCRRRLLSCPGAAPRRGPAEPTWCGGLGTGQLRWSQSFLSGLGGVGKGSPL